MRSKEVANDYRYFPEPDLLPVVIEQSWVDSIRASLPELPAVRRERFIADYGLGAYDATVLAAERPLAEFYETVAQGCGDAKIAANWVQVELLGQLNRNDLQLSESPVDAPALAVLLQRILDGSISGKIGKQVFEAMWAGEGDADSIIEARGLRQVSDSGALQAMVAEVIRDNPEQVAQYLAADEARRKKLSGFFVGQIMKLSRGQANPQMVSNLLNEQLADAGENGDT
ncbi:MAG TPA: Asp-tRNA(Asn)/Glu-tRNA(Gln) amidotransferase GatCAB subunit B, partial [Haliea salexigens]|nr:Asp-tRNA(Asn)/Glu-tRNA(Gln) amidotransferase GatCAB subunit B [Haliea salexigens]